MELSPPIGSGRLPPEDTWKDAAAAELLRRLLDSELHRSAGRAMFASAWTFGMMAVGEAASARAGELEPCCKLFSGARFTGGATSYDVFNRGAQPWQQDDETFQMTGDNGRVLWRDATLSVSTRSSRERNHSEV
jgi:hypothetical protein